MKNILLIQFCFLLLGISVSEKDSDHHATLFNSIEDSFKRVPSSLKEIDAAASTKNCDGENFSCDHKSSQPFVESKEEQPENSVAESSDEEKKPTLRQILEKLMPHQLNEDTSSVEGVFSSNENISASGENNYSDTIPDKVVENSKSLGYNFTVANATVPTNLTNSKKSYCIQLPLNETVIGDVEIINASSLQRILASDPNVTNRSMAAKCNLIYFFSPYCPFSAQGSAYVNALARSTKNIPVYGLNSIEFHSVNARYGVMGTPSLVLFHNGNVVARYNASEFSTFHLEAFIHHFTNQFIDSINVTSHDFKADLPSKVTPTMPYALYCSWIFLLLCGTWLFLSSDFYARLKEAILNNWREAEAHHAHDD